MVVASNASANAWQSVSTEDPARIAIDLATLLVAGPDAVSGMALAYYPSTDHYRVRNRQVVPSGGELRADLREAKPPGVDHIFDSRQQFGDDGYDHTIDITIARFGSEEDAAEFAENPAAITFPTTWEADVGFGEPEPLDDGPILQAVRAEDSVVATGYRAIWQEQDHAWAVYTVEPLQEERADREYTIRIDCIVLVPGDVSLGVTHTAPRNLWIEERKKGECFRNAL